MVPLLGVLGLMCFMWIVAMYATVREEPQVRADVSHYGEKAA